jgi:hypothetical protein
MILYLKDPKNSTQKLLDSINPFLILQKTRDWGSYKLKKFIAHNSIVWKSMPSSEEIQGLVRAALCLVEEQERIRESKGGHICTFIMN